MERTKCSKMARCNRINDVRIDAEGKLDWVLCHHDPQKESNLDPSVKDPFDPCLQVPELLPSFVVGMSRSGNP